MGFFSWNCKGCGESIKAPYGIPESMAWQNDAVCLGADGLSRLAGEYSGYGEIAGYDIPEDGDGPELWHQKCWRDKGEPKYTGPSDHAQDQGYFYDDPQGVEQ